MDESTDCGIFFAFASPSSRAMEISLLSSTLTDLYFIPICVLLLVRTV